MVTGCIDCQTMREYVTASYGWDDALQQRGFHKSLPAEQFVIICHHNRRVGGYFLEQTAAAHFVHMLLIAPEAQRLGIGTRVMQQLMGQASRDSKPLKLRVLHANQIANRWYQSLGFRQVDREPGYKLLTFEPTESPVETP